ncbi:GNAT family N-acetyltransferase [Vibrio metoecus]|uniref:GNAT family N-acetyltransferase n=1 Tax=Vibrio metoecus TaxID=1481663 RepID=UPI0006D81547|nr:GNAT family N-acetyltransferase [Vibrio metoecus]KQA16942.1 acetyltransferase [Vibrio metoecus]
MLIREGSLSEVVQLVEKIHEFAQQETEQSLQARLNNKTGLVLVAENDSGLLGFKIGYELDDETFYSWFGGVAPAARGHGVAQRLLEVQETWALEQGYQCIKVKSRNQFPAMLRLLIRNNYLIEEYEKKDQILESRIHFVKSIKK